MAVFGYIILQKRVLDADQLFPSSHVWNDRPSFHRKNFIGLKVVISTKFDFGSFISSKNEIKENHSKRSEVENFNSTLHF